MLCCSKQDSVLLSSKPCLDERSLTSRVQMTLDGDALSIALSEGRPGDVWYLEPQERRIEELMRDAPSGVGTGVLVCDRTTGGTRLLP